MNIGFIGLGNMGKLMSSLLVVKGYDVYGFEILQNEMVTAIKTGVVCLSSAAEVAKKSDVVICMLPQSSDTKNAIYGDHGMFSSLKEGMIIVDMGTGSPTDTKSTCADLVKYGVAFIDAPVSGGVKKAADGTLSIMASGDKEAYEKVLPILKCLGEDVFYVGEAGSGHTIKLINNMLTGINLAGICEGMVLGMKAGIDPDLLLSIINSSSGESYSSRVKVPNFILKRNFNGGFKTKLQHKDMCLASQLSKDLCVPTIMGNLAKEFFSAALSSGLGDEDASSVIKVLERIVGLDVKSKG